MIKGQQGQIIIQRMWRHYEEVNSVPVEHCVESGHFVDSHGRKFQQLGNIVHDADTCPSLVLSLPEVQKRDNSSFLVLRRVVGNNIFGSLQVLCVELERNLQPGPVQAKPMGTKS